jgi:tetratricopeptide (TPR) repeat protein
MDPREAVPWEDVSALVEAGLRWHEAGDVVAAEQCYLQALEREPGHPEALYLIGATYLELNRPGDAEAFTRRALDVSPGRAEAHFNLGLALQSLGRTEEAEGCYQSALELDPDDVDSHLNLASLLLRRNDFARTAGHLREVVRLAPRRAGAHADFGNVLANLGRPEEAVASYHEALRLAPENAEVCYALGNVLRKLDRLEDAAAAYVRAIRIRPSHHQAHNNLANVLRAQGRPREAEEAYRAALAWGPELPEVRINLGNVLVEQGRLEEAVARYRDVLTSHPDHPDAYNCLGNSLVALGRLDEAVSCYEEALRRRPEFPAFHVNIGNARRAQGHIGEALDCYGRALEGRSTYSAARWNRSLAWLLAGDFERGWAEYESRWQHGIPPPPYEQPPWDGGRLDGRTILLHAEQGLGDTLQFIRFAAAVRARGGRVVVVCQPRLVPLVSRCAGVDTTVAEGSALPAFDVHAPLMSLPRLLGASPGDWGQAVPYLVADDQRVAAWRAVLDQAPGYFRVGVAWQGNTKNPNDRDRSFRLAALAPLAAVEGVRLVSLQKGPGEDQLRAPGVPFPVLDLGGRLGRDAPFLDEAAVLMNLDLVIACDSSVAHLAGGLGRPVWVPLPFAADWRWMLHREDTPWYPTMRLFRQTAWGDWPGVFARMAAELAAHAPAHQRRHMAR